MPRARTAGASAVPPVASGASAWWTALDAVCGTAGVALVLVMGFGPVQAVAALVLLTIALQGSRGMAAAVQRRSRRSGIRGTVLAATAAA